MTVGGSSLVSVDPTGWTVLKGSLKDQIVILRV